MESYKVIIDEKFCNTIMQQILNIVNLLQNSETRSEAAQKYKELLSQIQLKGKISLTQEVQSYVTQLEGIFDDLETENDINEIFEKFNYNNQLKEYFFEIIRAMKNYYGKEKYPIIKDTFNQVPIHYQEENEDPSEYLTNFFGENYEFLYQRPTAGLCTISTMHNNEVKIKGIIYIVKEFDYIFTPDGSELHDYCFQVLIHEMSHAIKNMREPQILTNNTYKQFSGLNENVFKTDTDPYTMISDEWNEIDEAFNSFHEYELFEKITGRKPSTASVYKNTTSALVYMFKEIPGLKDAMSKAVFNNDKEWLTILGENNARRINDIFLLEHEERGKYLGENGILTDELNKIIEEIQEHNKRIGKAIDE